MKVNSIEEYLGTLQQATVETWKSHLKTDKYSDHKALNEFYDEIRLDHISIGDDLGWNIERGMIDLSFSSLVADDGTPCLVVDYQVSPKFGYSDLT